MRTSVCMMVKNEEKHIKNCLDSVVGLFDEIIIVDTGSLDCTIDIIESYGDSIKLTQTEWLNDFSYHRNQSIAKATGDWVFIIDADETLETKASKEEIKNTLESLTPETVCCTLQLKDFKQGNVQMEFMTARFFKKGTVQYEGIVHNAPQFKGDIAFLTDFTLNHYGYDFASDQEKERKKQRTLTLLHQRLADNPKDYISIFYLSQLHLEHGDPDLCLKYCEKYLAIREDAKKENNWMDSIYYTAAKTYKKKGSYDRALYWLKLGIDDIGYDLDLSFTLFDVGNTIKNNVLALEGAEEYIRQYAKWTQDKTIYDNRFIFSQHPKNLAYCIRFAAYSHFYSATSHLVNLLNIKRSLSKDEQNNIYNDLSFDISEIGVPDILKQIKPAVKAKKKKNKRRKKR